MIDGFTLGAYAAEPRRPALDARGEEGWFRALTEIEGARGMEVFFRGSLHPDGPGRLAELLPEGWHLVITALPQTVARTAKDPRYGLAAADGTGRRAAVDDIRRLLSEAHRIDALLGRSVVRAVEVHSAPTAAAGVRADAAALARSLRELSDASEGIPLVVEHCDALVPWHRPVKGFLSLREECDAVRSALEDGVRTGLSLNWGRSAIEGRSRRTPVEHIRELVGAGLLRGLMFSGAPRTSGALGAAWDDLHNPLRADDPTSLLDEGDVRSALASIDASTRAQQLLFLGAKVQDPADAVEQERRLAPLERLIGAVRAGWEET